MLTDKDRKIMIVLIGFLLFMNFIVLAHKSEGIALVCYVFDAVVWGILFILFVGDLLEQKTCPSCLGRGFTTQYDDGTCDKEYADNCKQPCPDCKGKGVI